MTVSGMFGMKPATRSPALMPSRAQRRGDARDLVEQLAIGQPPLRAALVPEDDRLAIVAIAKEILGEVEPRADEPLRSELGIGRRDAIAADEHTLARDRRIAAARRRRRRTAGPRVQNSSRSRIDQS